MDVVEGFPRGNGSATSLQHSSAHSEGSTSKDSNAQDGLKTDTLFGNKGIAQNMKRKLEVAQNKAPSAHKKQRKKVDVTVTAEDSSVTDKAFTITFKSIKKEMLLLGCIRDITETELVISLPNRLIGTVSRQEISDAYHQVDSEKRKTFPSLSNTFALNQFVPCIVLNVGRDEKGKKIDLSMRLSLLHTEYSPEMMLKGMSIHGFVKSIEDAGAIIDIGVRGVQAYLPKSMQVTKMELQIGQQYLFSIVSLNPHTLTATLSFDQTNVVKSVTRGKQYALKHFLPGQLLNVRVEHIFSNGVGVNFLTYFQGTVDYNHLSRLCLLQETDQEQNWSSFYKHGMKARARIIGIDRLEKKIMMSMAPHIIHLDQQVHTADVKIGTIVEKAMIERIDSGFGMLLSLPQTAVMEREKRDKSSAEIPLAYVPGYVHVSNISDTRVDNKYLAKTYKTGDTITCRVSGFSPFENLIVLSCKPSSLSQTVLRHSDLVEGQRLQAKILAMKEWGILLEISEGVRGLVTMQHVPPFLHSKLIGTKSKLPNASLKESHSKYEIGKVIQAQVLHIDRASKKTYLTLKRGLMASKYPVLSSFKQAEPGLVCMGFITKIADYGLIVSFYGGVYGLVPTLLLQQADIQNVREAYALGQVVRACVTRCDPERQRLMLTLNASSSLPSVMSKTLHTSERIGSIIRNVTVLEIIKSEHRIRVITEDNLDGEILFTHLTDFPRQTSIVDQIITSLSVGQVWKDQNFLVLSESLDNILQLTCKPLLIRHRSRIPRSIQDTEKGALYMGYIVAIEPKKGVFVRFLQQFTGLVTKAFTEEKFVQEIESEKFQNGETVLCAVAEKRENEKESSVTLDFRARNFMKASNSRDDLLSLSYFAEWLEVCSFIETKDSWGVGKAVVCDFVAVRQYGAVFSASKGDEKATVIVRDAIDFEMDLQVDSQLKILLIDYDVEKRLYYGTMDKKLVKAGSSKRRKRWQRVKSGELIKDARVIYIGHTEQYVIIAFYKEANSSNIQFGIVQLNHFYSPSISASNLGLSIDSKFSCLAISASVQEYRKEMKKTPFNDLPLFIIAPKEQTRKRIKLAHSKSIPKYANPSADFQIGKLITGCIASIREDLMEIRLRTSKSHTISAIVSIYDVDSTENEMEHPFDHYSVDTIIQGRVLSLMQKGSNKRKLISETNPATYHVVYLSLRKSDIESSNISSLVRVGWTENTTGRRMLREDAILEGVVTEYNASGLFIRLSHSVLSFLHCLEISKDMEIVKKFRQLYPVGTRISKCYVTNVDEERKRVDLSLMPNSKETRVNELKVPGNVVLGQIIRGNAKPAIKFPSLTLQLGSHTFGRVCITELVPPAQWHSNLLDLSSYNDGNIVESVVLPSLDSFTELSLRSDRRENIEPPPVYRVGDLVTGFIVSVSKAFGCFVRLHYQINARVLLRDLSDNFIQEPESEFPVGKVVVGRITSVTADKKQTHYGLSLKPSIVSENVNMLRIIDLKEGMVVKGRISKVQTYGVFVKLNKSNLSGLCHISQIADKRVEEPLENLFNENDFVKAKVLKLENGKISLGLKPSYFENDEDKDMAEADDSATKKTLPNQDVELLPSAKLSTSPEAMHETSDDDSQVAEEHTTSIGFAWDGFAEDTEMEIAPKIKQDKSIEKPSFLNNDEWVSLRESALAKNEHVPQSAQDYERLLVINPHSSYLWIQYMTFYVSLTELDLARDVAIRATKTFAFQDEKEKLNVWVAYMNLEHDFGDDANFLRVFNTALRVNHPKRVYLHLLNLYARSNQHEQCMETLVTMQKKFRKSKQIWIRGLQYLLLEHVDHDRAATLFQNAVQFLPDHKHLQVILKYAQFMYDPRAFDANSNVIEKARTIFEGILSTYPKRMDLWNVYLDKEIRLCSDKEKAKEDCARVRQLFERLISMKLSAKKMKFWFKKYLKFEQKYGDQERLEHVRALAKEFVENAIAN